MKLLDAVDANTTGESVRVPNYGGRWRSHEYSCYVYGDSLGGGTVTLQVSPDGPGVSDANSNWFTARRSDENQAIFTVFDVQTVIMRAAKMRAKLEGAVGPSNVSVSIY